MAAFDYIPRFYWNSFFIAVPEAALEDSLIDYLKAKKLIDPDGIERINAIRASLRRAGRVKNRLRNKNLIERLLIIAPELINRQSLDALEGVGMIARKDASILRLALRFGAVAQGGGAPPAVILQRLRKVFGIGFATDALNLAVDLTYLTRKEADKAKAVLLLGNSTVETLKALQHAKSWQNVLMLLANGSVNKDTIAALRLAGLMDSRTANAMIESLEYGASLWTVFEGSKKAEGYAARLAYVVSGTFSQEAVDALAAISEVPKKELEKIGLQWFAGKIGPEEKFLLRIAAQTATNYNRHMMEQMTERRYRVKPGERPIVAFARSSKETDDAILQLLSKAADDAAARARALAGAARGADYAIKARALHQTMRQLWEGNGILTIFGEHKVADAAFEASQMLEKRFYQHMPQDIQTMLGFQAKAGLDSYISRKENTLQLSRRVYKNLDLWNGKVDQTVNIGLLQGQSADEIAKRVSGMINPNVMGGVKYAAMRIGRTEIANAFHNTTIRYSREQPWVRGYLWNRSSSHGHSDVCDEMATDDHDGLGPGIYKKANVPQKPHPQCLCYLTVVSVDDKQFIKNFNRGFYNQYINSRINSPEAADTFMNSVLDTGAKVFGAAAGQVALTAGSVMVERMVRVAGPKIKAFNFRDLVGQSKAAVIAKVSSFQKKQLATDAIEGTVADYGMADVTKPATANKIVKQVSKEEELLASRTTAFNSLLDTYRQHDIDHGSGKAIEDHYLNVFGEKDEGVGIKPIFTDSQLELYGKDVYGMSSYRTMNAKLRMSHGDLDVYDDAFHEGDEFFGSLHQYADRLEEDGLGQTVIDSASEARDFAKLDVKLPVVKAADKAGMFGLSDKSIDTYYEEASSNFIARLENARKTGNFSEAIKEFTKINRHSDVVRTLDRAMQPTVDDNFVWRIADKDWTGLGHDPTPADIGAVFKDHAYVSTEGRPEYFFNKGVNSLDQEHRATRFMIHIPEGTMATRFNTFENEVGLARGSKFQILNVLDVKDQSGFNHEVHLALIDQDDSWSAAQEFFSKHDEDDMWDTIMGEF